MKIEFLKDNPEYCETAAKWIYDEFIDGIKHGVTYENVLSRVRECEKATLPIRLVAIEDDICVATISLVGNDLRCRSYTPWLASLYVDVRRRGRKIGEALVERIKDIAKELGYKELYLRTEHAGDYYRRLGWQFVESCEDDYDLVPDVFKISLE
jgi:predicted N-acetyltransferase YhbS